jgi:hypothetical protein
MRHTVPFLSWARPARSGAFSVEPSLSKNSNREMLNKAHLGSPQNPGSADELLSTLQYFVHGPTNREWCAVSETRCRAGMAFVRTRRWRAGGVDWNRARCWQCLAGWLAGEGPWDLLSVAFAV